MRKSIFLKLGIWGLGIGDWGFGPITNPQSPIPNPHIKNYFTIFYQKLIKKIVQNYKSMVKGISTHQKLNKKIKVKNE